MSERIDIETVNHFQNTFKTPSGRIVFAAMLDQFGFFKGAIETEEDRIRLNEAHAFLANCGIWHPKNGKAIADALLALPAYEQEEPKQDDGEDFLK